VPRGSTVRIRRAEPGDADALARLGRALNVQQGDPSEHFTADAVRRDGFGETPKFEAWLADDDGEIVGYAMVLPAAYETGFAKAGVYLQDLFVAPEARRRGIGRALLAAVAADTRRRGLEFVWWGSRTWNTDAHAFFRKLATVEEPIVAFAVFGEEFEKLADSDTSQTKTP
jgi:GNAT superfamily N-acetyltransferase